MAVPKRRHSKSRKRIKKACWKIQPLNLRPCPNCGVSGRSHHACAECGMYNGRQVIEIKTKTPEDKS
jgi:large subunit ribosomal protein L32